MTGYFGIRSIGIVWLMFQLVGLTILAFGQELLLESAKQDYFNGGPFPDDSAGFSFCQI